MQGRIQDFKLRGAHLKKLHRAEGGAKIFGVFRVKNHDFTPKNDIYSNCGGRREKFWGISCEKSRFYAKKIVCFPILAGAHHHPPPPTTPPHGSAPAMDKRNKDKRQKDKQQSTKHTHKTKDRVTRTPLKTNPQHTISSAKPSYDRPI